MPNTTSTLPSDFSPSAQQYQALDDINAWLRDPFGDQVFYLAGYAGTGKTTLARTIARMVNGLVLFAAFTGKAASVLRKKGCPDARTLHSILYDVADADRSQLRQMVKDHQDLVLAYEDLSLSRDFAEERQRLSGLIMALARKIAEERERTKGPRFALNPLSIMTEASLLILDECSMVDARLGKDALSFGKRVLVIGDPAQLPPVYGNGYFTSSEPDFLLTEIHRQAQENPIIRAATAIRQHRPIPYGEWGSIQHLRRSELGDGNAFITEAVRNGTQILCGKNETRKGINRVVRYNLGYRSRLPQEGEPIVVTRNDAELGVLNGVLCRAASDAKPDGDGGYMISLDYEGINLPYTPLDPAPFNAYWNSKLTGDENAGQRHLLSCDWGYAITVHKAQGSEWQDVTLVDDGFGRGDLRWQWLYTAITRASERMTIISGPRS